MIRPGRPHARRSHRILAILSLAGILSAVVACAPEPDERDLDTPERDGTALDAPEPDGAALDAPEPDGAREGAASRRSVPSRYDPSRDGLAVRMRELRVTATAYNTLPGQTEGDPRLAAWGDTLRPGMRAIAVSRDLERLGLIRGTRVEIEGRPGEYIVRDRMSARWYRRIDIYKGEDLEAARAWGRQRVTIRWTVAADP